MQDILVELAEAILKKPDQDFLCYVRQDWNPQIRPAPATRAWMDASSEAFAYRCLPMDIANAHGWEILAPAGFSAVWLGGPRKEDVLIKPDSGTPHGGAPVSAFGEGTITFHVNGIFRTPLGWNLLVTGSPNWAKDGIAALTGIIETDWSPYTFTMNWRFTRRGRWVRWEAGEPICFLMPVQRGALEQFRPRIVPLSKDPDLAGQLADWTKSRNDWHAKMAQTMPKKPADQWQKTYMQGRDMHGATPAADHQTRIRLHPFVKEVAKP